jgi:hypothetical protein
VVGSHDHRTGSRDGVQVTLDPDAHDCPGNDAKQQARQADEPVHSRRDRGLADRPPPGSRGTGFAPLSTRRRVNADEGRVSRCLGFGCRGHRVGRGARLLGGADRLHDQPNGLMERVAIGSDHDRILCGSQRRDRTARVELVAALELGDDLGGLRRSRIDAALEHASVGALVDRRVEEQLQVGIRQHHGTRVAPGHHDPARAREPALAGEDGQPQLADAGDRRDGGVHVGTVHLDRPVDPVD